MVLTPIRTLLETYTGKNFWQCLQSELRSSLQEGFRTIDSFKGLYHGFRCCTKVGRLRFSNEMCQRIISEVP